MEIKPTELYDRTVRVVYITKYHEAQVITRDYKKLVASQYRVALATNFLYPLYFELGPSKFSTLMFEFIVLS